MSRESIVGKYPDTCQDTLPSCLLVQTHPKTFADNHAVLSCPMPSPLHPQQYASEHAFGDLPHIEIFQDTHLFVQSCPIPDHHEDISAHMVRHWSNFGIYLDICQNILYCTFLCSWPGASKYTSIQSFNVGMCPDTHPIPCLSILSTICIQICVQTSFPYHPLGHLSSLETCPDTCTMVSHPTLSGCICKLEEKCLTLTDFIHMNAIHVMDAVKDLSKCDLCVIIFKQA